jgi:hypothetical protein
MLPVLLLCLGDSICGGWSNHLQIPFDKPNENCRSTRNAIKNLERWTAGKHYDAVVFNFGLWDVKEGTPIDEYKRNLSWILTEAPAGMRIRSSGYGSWR